MSNRKMLSASTDIPADVDQIVRDYCTKNDRKRAWVLRLAIVEWAKRQGRGK